MTRSVRVKIEIVVNAMTIRESIKFIVIFCVCYVYVLDLSLAFFLNV